MKNRTYYKNKFSKNGYVIIRNFFNMKEIDLFESHLLRVYSKHLNVNLNKKTIHSTVLEHENKKNYNTLYKALKSYCKTKPFKLTSVKLRKLSKLFFDNNYKHITSGMAIGMNKSKRTSYNWHQEKPYYKDISTIHYQFPIFNACKSSNGTMSVLAGSHNLGFIKKVNNIKLSKKSINSYIPKEIKTIKNKYSEKFINMNLKDIVLFNENLIHRTNNNISNKVRFAGIIRLREYKK